MCHYGENIKNITQYLFPCSNYLNERMTLWSNLENVEEKILDRSYSETVLLGDSSSNNEKNTSILISVIQYILDT